MNPMLRLKGIEKNFGKRPILKGVDLTVNPGDLIYIKGKNGSGKSTLLKIIGGILSPDAGDITFSSTVKLGGLIENPGFLENENLLQNFKYLASISSTFNEKYTEDLCQLLSLDLYQRDQLKTYSVGMRQKAGIILAIAEGQNLILLDEPTRGLDQESTEKFNQLITQLVADKKSVLLISHEAYPELAFTQQFTLNDGRLVLLSKDS